MLNFGLDKKRLAAWAEWWRTPSQLGVKLILNGLGCLAVSIIFGRIGLTVTAPTRWQAELIADGISVVWWLVWAAGMGLTALGLIRLILIDMRV
jgi:hypothetical protein